MSIEEEVKYRATTINDIDNLLTDLSKDIDRIESIVVGVLFNDDCYRVTHIGSIVSRYGLIDLLKIDLDEFRQELEK